jgi:hypothetical protein
MDLQILSPVHLHVVVLNLITTGTTLTFYAIALKGVRCSVVVEAVCNRFDSR